MHACVFACEHRCHQTVYTRSLCKFKWIPTHVFHHEIMTMMDADDDDDGDGDCDNNSADGDDNHGDGDDYDDD